MLQWTVTPRRTVARRTWQRLEQLVADYCPPAVLHELRDVVETHAESVLVNAYQQGLFRLCADEDEELKDAAYAVIGGALRRATGNRLTRVKHDLLAAWQRDPVQPSYRPGGRHDWGEADDILEAAVVTTLLALDALPEELRPDGDTLDDLLVNVAAAWGKAMGRRGSVGRVLARRR